MILYLKYYFELYYTINEDKFYGTCEFERVLEHSLLGSLIIRYMYKIKPHHQWVDNLVLFIN